MRFWSSPGLHCDHQKSASAMLTRMPARFIVMHACALQDGLQSHRAFTKASIDGGVAVYASTSVALLIFTTSVFRPCRRPRKRRRTLTRPVILLDSDDDECGKEIMMESQEDGEVCVCCVHICALLPQVWVCSDHRWSVFLRPAACCLRVSGCCLLTVAARLTVQREQGYHFVRVTLMLTSS